MKLEKAVELLQGRAFYMKGLFLSTFDEDFDANYALTVIDEEHTLRPVDIEYKLKVVDAKTLLHDINIDLDEITTKVDLLNKVNKGLCNIIMEVDSDDVGGVERGVERF